MIPRSLARIVHRQAVEPLDDARPIDARRRADAPSAFHPVEPSSPAPAATTPPALRRLDVQPREADAPQRAARRRSPGRRPAPIRSTTSASRHAPACPIDVATRRVEAPRLQDRPPNRSAGRTPATARQIVGLHEGPVIDRALASRPAAQGVLPPPLF